jgi:hypothetical protein
MVQHIVLFKLKPEINDEKVEQMMRNTRIQLLKIPEVLSVKCGKRISTENDWPFFIAVEFESMDKLAVYLDDSIHLKYVQDVIKPHTTERMALDYEMEPGKDVQYS